MDSPEQKAVLETLLPSAHLALLHAQAAQNGHDATMSEETSPVDETVLSSHDPIVINNAAFAEPIFAGDSPIPIHRQASAQVTVKPKKTKEKLDLSSESAFPSLSASAAPRQPALSAWSSGASRVKSTQESQPARPSPRAAAAATPKKANVPHTTDVLDLPAHQQIANLPNKPLGFKGNADVIRQVMSKTGTNIIASTNRSGTTTFLIQGPPNDVAKAKRELLAGLVVKRTVEMTVPASARRFIIGTKGKTLQQIEALSGVRINFPRKEEDDKSQSDDANDEEVVVVTLYGDAAGINDAKKEISKIVDEKTAKPVIKVDTIDPSYYLLLAGPQNESLSHLEKKLDVKIQLPSLPTVRGETAISISGDREKIQVAKQMLEERFEMLKNLTREAFVPVPKCKHKYLIGKNGAALRDILQQSGCSIEIPAFNEASEIITIRGPEDRLKEGLSLVLGKANEVHVKVLDLVSVHKQAPNPVQHAKVMLQQLKKGALKELETKHNVQIGFPPATDKSLVIEFVSNVEQDASHAYSDAFALSRKLVPELTASVDIEPHLHRYINTRHARQLERIKSQHNVDVLFPEEDAEVSTVLVFSLDAEYDVNKAKEATSKAIADLQKIVAESADFVSKTVVIPAEHHKLIAGPRDTTLNALLGPESSVSVRFGVGAPDNVNLRGLSDEVKQAISALSKVYDLIQRNAFVESHTAEFTIPAAFSAHVIGKAGANINKLKEDLGVKIDIGDAASEEQGKSGKKGKDQTVKVTVHGVKINVEAAQERIKEMVANLADQVTLSLNVPHEFHRYLIGQNGRYVRRLAEKYNVHIKFPRSASGDGELNGASDSTITVRGRKKEANTAKEELLELYEYEKEEQKKRKEEQEKRSQREAQRKEMEKKKAEEKSKN